MFDIETYIAQLTALLRAKLGDRLLYVGLQNMYCLETGVFAATKSVSSWLFAICAVWTFG